MTTEHGNSAGVNKEPSLQVYLIHVNSPVGSVAMDWMAQLWTEVRKAAQIPLGIQLLASWLETMRDAMVVL